MFYDEHAIAGALRTAGIEVHVLPNQLPADFSAGLRRLAPSLASLAGALRPFQRAYNFIWHFFGQVLSCVRLIHRWRVDIVHLNNSLNSNHEWMVAAKLGGVRAISHERGISERLSRTSIVLGRRLDAIVCVSEVTKAPLLRQGLNAERISVIYDGLDTNHFAGQASTGRVREEYGLPSGAPVVGVVGNIKHWKGQEVMIRATSILAESWPDIRCLLVGGFNGDDEYKRRLDTLIHDSGLHGNIIFTGFQERPWDFIGAMDVVVHSSIEPEPFGMVNLEAMYMKKPVVSTTIGGPAEIFEHGTTGVLIAPGDPKVLAEAVAHLLSDPGTRTRLGEAAHDAVVRRFRIDDTVRKLESLFERVCA